MLRPAPGCQGVDIVIHTQKQRLMQSHSEPGCLGSILALKHQLCGRSPSPIQWDEGRTHAPSGPGGI